MIVKNCAATVPSAELGPAGRKPTPPEEDLPASSGRRPRRATSLPAEVPLAVSEWAEQVAAEAASAGVSASRGTPNHVAPDAATAVDLAPRAPAPASLPTEGRADAGSRPRRGSLGEKNAGPSDADRRHTVDGSPVPPGGRRRPAAEPGSAGAGAAAAAGGAQPVLAERVKAGSPFFGSDPSVVQSVALAARARLAIGIRTQGAASKPLFGTPPAARPGPFASIATPRSLAAAGGATRVAASRAWLSPGGYGAGRASSEGELLPGGDRLTELLQRSEDGTARPLATERPSSPS